MKKLLILLFSILISFNSYGEWIKVGTTSGADHYLHLENSREHNGYVYYWSMMDYFEPYKGYMSDQVYSQGDCKIFRFRPIEGTFYKKPMGEGETKPYPPPPEKWRNPRPNSIGAIELNLVCDYLK